MSGITGFFFGRRDGMNRGKQNGPPHGRGIGQGSGHKNKSHRNGPKADHPWEVMIDVYLNAVAADGTPDFDIQTCLPTDWPSGDENPIVHFHNDGRNGFSVTFRFFDNTGSTKPYIFLNDAKDALWSVAGSDCPTEKCGAVFTSPTRVDDTTLSAMNMNHDVLGPFQYALRVSKDGTQKDVVTLDPGGNNMNGNYGFQ
jgi:hypothetical protein